MAAHRHLLLGSCCRRSGPRWNTSTSSSASGVGTARIGTATSSRAIVEVEFFVEVREFLLIIISKVRAARRRGGTRTACRGSGGRRLEDIFQQLRFGSVVM